MEREVSIEMANIDANGAKTVDSLDGEDKAEEGEKAFVEEIQSTATHKDSNDVKATRPLSRFTKWRNIIGFWILGLANNYPYVIMLSAAFDIIHKLSGNHGGHQPHPNATETEYNTSCTLVNGSYEMREKCEKAGTSVILLADILPTFLIKLFAPYVMNFVPYWIRVFGTVLFSFASFLFVGLGMEPGLVIFGVICASISSGFGEITFLSLTARYDKSTVSGWSSGTGAAGVAGALVYAGLTFIISADNVLLIQLFMPAVMLVTYLFILGKPRKILPSSTDIQDEEQEEKDEKLMDDSKPLLEEAEDGGRETDGRVLKEAKRVELKLKFFNKEETGYWLSHVKYIPRLWKYMLPLFLVYWAEYMINQGFFELLYNANTHVGHLCINQEAQYRLLQVMYQVGVLISRSSVSIYHFKWFWIFSVLQLVNFVFFYFAAVYLFLPSFWLTIFIVLYEGLLGGGVYVNAFYAISKKVPKVHREFSMGVASIADSTGIMLAAFLAQAVHSSICSHVIGYEPS